MVIKNGGSEAAVADTVLDINKNAKIVSAARNWRQYLIQVWSNKVARITSYNVCYTKLLRALHLL